MHVTYFYMKICIITNKCNIFFIKSLTSKIFRICEMNIMLMARGNAISKLPQTPWGSISNTVFTDRTRNFPQSTSYDRYFRAVLSNVHYNKFVQLPYTRKGRTSTPLSKYTSGPLIMSLKLFFSCYLQMLCLQERL